MLGGWAGLVLSAWDEVPLPLMGPHVLQVCAVPRCCWPATGSCWSLVTNSPDFLGLRGFWDMGLSELKPKQFWVNWDELLKTDSAEAGGRRALAWVPTLAGSFATSGHSGL